MIEKKLVCDLKLIIGTMNLWDHVVIQHGVFIRLKITSYIASSMNNSKNSWRIWC